MHEKGKELEGILSEQCARKQDIHDLLKGLFKGGIEKMLEAEMETHLGYEKKDIVVTTAETAITQKLFKLSSEKLN